MRLLDVLARLAADLIERSQAEKALQNLNADLKHFSYAASHDLQEPLRMVMSYTQLLARQYKGRLDQEADQLIAYAVEGAQRMEALLRDLREYCSVNEQKIQNLGSIDCSRVLEKALAYLDFPLQESGAVVTHDSLPMVLAEEFPLTLLFQNLIGNAIKYRRLEAPPRIHLSAQRSAAAWRISVTDNGIGIEAKHLETIFAPFKRLHGAEYPGTGLGLAMCQRVVERYRGQIWVESKYGQGSTFHFTLPASTRRVWLQLKLASGKYPVKFSISVKGGQRRFRTLRRISAVPASSSFEEANNIIEGRHTQDNRANRAHPVGSIQLTIVTNDSLFGRCDLAQR